MNIIHGGVCAPKGFEAAGIMAGIKKEKKDMALVYSQIPAVGAAVYTTNLVKAWCVQRNQEMVQRGGPIQAIVANSGCANACTGQEGKENNETVAAAMAAELGIDKNSILTAATGVIGAQLPMDKLLSGVKILKDNMGSSEKKALEGATAILTTDTRPKYIAVECEIGGVPVRIGGMVKGSGMIHPNMATMLCFLTTDAVISKELLQKALSCTVVESYNRISVDGDTSTNDMAMIMANGLAGNAPINEEGEAYEIFAEALQYVNHYLAKEMIRDGEGATKLIEVQVTGAATKEDAVTIAKSIITSQLVKTAFFGEDANWGRVLCAAGYSGARFDPDKVTIRFASAAGEILLMDCGTPIVFDEEKAAAILHEPEVTVYMDLGAEGESAVAWGSDLTYDYVKINGDYRS